MKKIPGERKAIYNQIKLYLKGFRSQALKLSATKLILLAVDLLTPFLFKLLIDNVMIDRQINMLKFILIGYIAAFIISTIALTYQKYITNKLNKYTFNIRHKLWKNYINMPPDIYEKFNAGDLKNRLDTDTDTFKSFITDQTMDYIFYWIIGFVDAIILLYINWKLALFGFLMVPLSFWMTKWLGGKLKKSREIQRKTFGKYEGWLQGSLQGWKEIKALNLEKSESKTFTHYWHILSKQIFATRMYWFGNRCFIAIKDFFITKMNIYFIGGLLIINGEITIGSLLIFMKYYEQMFSSIGSINDLDIQLNSDIPSIERVMEALNLDIATCENLPPKEKFKGNIEFKDVTFKYASSEAEVLQNIKLEILPGQKIAIVGRSGCGKTTLVKLLLGLYEPIEGSIFIDGNNIKDMSPITLHRNIGVVMQDNFLFNMTIKENLLLGKPSATDEEIKAACKMAYINEFIENLSINYDTLIGEKGIKLSGGQKQRLSIAKVMLSAPNIIIFDEATSALDHESEKAIHAAIENISKDRTVIVIAHRLSSILSADKIIVLDNGKISATGSHEELLGKNKIYDALFRKQYEGLLVK